jgi:hypothetical protein
MTRLPKIAEVNVCPVMIWVLSFQFGFFGILIFAIA